MSLATRCAACGTVFRVVPDQLKVSEGWVRCGNCREIFNAEECLIGPLPDSSGTQEDFDLSLAPEAAGQDLADSERDAGIKEWAGEAQTQSPNLRPVDEEPLSGTPPTPWAELAPLPNPVIAQQEPFYFDTDALAASFKASALYDSDLTFEPGGERNLEAVLPTFLRQAERAERWNRPAVRAVLGLACVALATLLLAQLAYLKRDEMAAHFPSTRPLILAACGALGCKVSSPLQIEDISLDSSQLSATSSASVLRLDVSIHNQAKNAVLMPALELNFTAISGAVLARRVVAPAELSSGSESLEAEGHWASTLWLDVGELPVAGYTVAVFYP
jgi:predicted Zn finger-like uncharacterized protein